MTCGGFSLAGLGEVMRHPSAGVPRGPKWLGILFEVVWSKTSTVSLAILSVFFLATHEYLLAMMCSGFFLAGLGEGIKRPSTDVSRRANWLGILLEVAGVVLMYYTLYLWLTLP